MKWFRLWTDILDDPKLSQLEDGDYRRFIGLLAMASESDKAGVIPHEIDKIAWRLRCRKDHLEKCVKKLINLNILKQNGNGFLFLNWEKRQFQSDNSTKRWRKWKANVCPTLAPTATDTDTDTDTYKEKKNTQAKKVSFQLPEWFPEETWSVFLSHRKAVKAPVSEKAYPLFIEKFARLKHQRWEPKQVIDIMIEKGWRWFKPEWIKEPDKIGVSQQKCKQCGATKVRGFINGICLDCADKRGD